MLPFRRKQPQRTYKGKHNDYKKYKEPLSKDFNERCGYTDCHQSFFGGRRNFHIDHFKAKVHYPELEKEYSNLVYSCSYVNIAKGDDDNDLYLDPCNVDFNIHFERDKYGNINPLTTSKEAIYMHNKLKLYLKRYGITWALDTLFEKWLIIREKLDEIEDESVKSELTILKKDLADEFVEYFHYLRKEL